jgi:DNA-binding transcriptional ArsR family regulator
LSKTPDVYQAIADVNRRRLLELLCEKERAVQELVPYFGMTFGAISQHLKILRETGLVSRREEGRFRYYRATLEALKEVHDWTEQCRRFWESRLDQLGDVLDDTP